jgi:SAM-dependent methyltransferase
MILIYLTIILLICYVVLHNRKFEGFAVDNKSKLFINEFKTYRDERIYDDFYSYIYDDLFLTIPYLQEFINTISNTMNGNSNVLCIGSKNGHIVQLLSKEVIVCGIENSSSMVKMSKYKYPENIYLYGNYLDNTLFKDNHFTHIVLPMMTLNTVEDIHQLFDNIQKWLIHNGYLIIMLLDLETIHISDLITKNPSPFFKNTFDYDIELNKNNITDRIRNHQGYERTDIQSIYHHKEDKIIYSAQINGLKYKYSKVMNSMNSKILYFQKG